MGQKERALKTRTHFAHRIDMLDAAGEIQEHLAGVEDYLLAEAVWRDAIARLRDNARFNQDAPYVKKDEGGVRYRTRLLIFVRGRGAKHNLAADHLGSLSVEQQPSRCSLNPSAPKRGVCWALG